MTIRSRREVVTLRHQFRISGVDRLLPAGPYEVHCIISTHCNHGLVPAAARGSTMEMISIGSVDLADAQRIDASMPDD